MACSSRFVPWSQAELSLLIAERQKDPPTPYKRIAEMLPGRTPHGCHRAATDLALTDWENSLTCRIKHKDKEREVFATIQTCVLDKGMTATQTRDYLDNVRGWKFSRSAISKRLVKMKDGTPEEQEVYRVSQANAKRSRALRISITRKRKYRNGEYDHVMTNRGVPHGQNARSKGKGQDQSDPEQVQLLLRTTRHAGHGTERHA